MLFEFFHDLSQALIFGFLPTPFYISADIEPGELLIFSSLIKEGKVYYNPQYGPKSYGLSLVADMGPLLGIPCTVAISGEKIKITDFYFFSGISFSGCRERAQSTVTFSSSDEISVKDSSKNICAACSLNLSTLSKSLSKINPLMRFSTFFLKALVRLSKNYKEPHDLPRSWVVSPLQLSLSYRFWGEISKSCAYQLLKGKSCLPKFCQREMIENFTREYQASPFESSFNCFLNKGVVKIRECDSPIHLQNSGKLLVKTNCNLARRGR
jgi:hypothetical protein